MNGKDDASTQLWVALTRAQRRALAGVEARLKAAGLPPMSWYDALWELEKADPCGLRPFELGQAMLFEQYNLSRLADRLEKAGLIERRSCPQDRRGQMLVVTREGRSLRQRMWRTYEPAIKEALGRDLGVDEMRLASRLLDRLG